MLYEDTKKTIVNLIKNETHKDFLLTYKIDKIYTDYVKSGGCSVRTLKDTLYLMFKSVDFYFTDETLTDITYLLLDAQ